MAFFGCSSSMHIYLQTISGQTTYLHNIELLDYRLKFINTNNIFFLRLQGADASPYASGLEASQQEESAAQGAAIGPPAFEAVICEEQMCGELFFVFGSLLAYDIYDIRTYIVL